MTSPESGYRAGSQKADQDSGGAPTYPAVPDSPWPFGGAMQIMRFWCAGRAVRIHR